MKHTMRIKLYFMILCIVILFSGCRNATVEDSNIDTVSENSNELIINMTDYKDIRACFDYVYSMGDKYEKYYVEVPEGVYNTEELFTEEEWNNEGKDVGWNYYYGLTIPDNCYLVGIGAVDKIVFQNGGSKPDSDVKSPLNFKNSGGIENITVKAKGCRYAIHDDMAWNAEHYTRIVRNCKIIDNGSTIKAAYGSGIYGDCDFFFYNTEFIAYGDAYPFSLHNTIDQKKVGNITFIGCTFKGNNKGCVFPSLSPLSAKTYITMIGCKVDNILFSEIPDNSGIAFELSGGGNSECNIEVKNSDGKKYEFSFADDKEEKNSE